MPKFKGKIVSETVGDKIQEFLSSRKEKGLEETSIKDYETKLKIILNEDMPFDAVEWSVTVLSIQSMELSPSSKESYLKSLRCFIRWCGVDYSVHIKSTETVKPVYTDEEIKLLLKKPVKCTFTELRTYTMLMLAFDTGMRIGSLRNLRVEDVGESSIIVRKTKTHKVQMLPFSNTTHQALVAFLKHRMGTGEDFLFCDVYGNQLSTNAPRKALVAYCNKVGVKCKGWHCCRHTFAKKFLLDCGESPFMLQQMLGHSTLEQSRHYCNLFNADLMNNYASPIESMHRKQIKGRN